MKKISIITPCFNESENILHCYKEVKKVFEKKLNNYKYEHIFSDNCSDDNSYEILKNIAKKDKNIKVIINSRNFGIFRSTFNAIRRASGHAVVPKMDVDMQDPPELIIKFIQYWEKGYDVVSGRRSKRKENFFMKILRKLFYRIIYIVSEFHVPKDVGEYQLLDRKVINALMQFDDYNPYIRGLIAKCGYETKIIDYTQNRRLKGKSKFNIFGYIDIFINGLISFSNIPMRISMFIGIIIAMASIIYSIYLFSLPIFFGITLENQGIMTILVAIFFFFGIVFIFLGILGEYVSAIHSQVRKGPIVFEKEIINFQKK